MATPHTDTGDTTDTRDTGHVAAEVPFRDICNLMEAVAKQSSLEKKKRIFGSFLERWREEHKRLHPTDASTTVSVC